MQNYPAMGWPKQIGGSCEENKIEEIKSKNKVEVFWVDIVLRVGIFSREELAGNVP